MQFMRLQRDLITHIMLKKMSIQHSQKHCDLSTRRIINTLPFIPQQLSFSIYIHKFVQFYKKEFYAWDILLITCECKVTESDSKPKYRCNEVPLTNFWITWFSVGFEVLSLVVPEWLPLLFQPSFLMQHGSEQVFQNLIALFIVVFDGRQVCHWNYYCLVVLYRNKSDSWWKSVPENIISVYNEMGKKENQIWKMACNHFQELLNKVHYILFIKKFRETRLILEEHNSHSWKKQTSTHEDNKFLHSQKTRQYNSVTELGMKRISLQWTVHELGPYSYFIWLLHQLWPHGMARSHVFCDFENVCENKNFLNNSWYSDGCHVMLCGYMNK
jgi:hypothetical protein